MSQHRQKYRKKLIEVAIPLEAINQACQEEKAVPRRSHPGTIHYWWAPRPLAAARAILLCQLIDDPGDVPEEFKNEEEVATERIRLFHCISKACEWESTFNQGIIGAAREEVLKSWRRYLADNMMSATETPLPSFLDPFAGGGAIPLEAQRLGFRSVAADLNPISVLINKAKLEIPSYLQPSSPVLAPLSKDGSQGTLTEGADFNWHGSTGLAYDVSTAGSLVLSRARAMLSELYPRLPLTMM